MRDSLARRASKKIQAAAGPCPITHGLPTKLVEATAKKLCASHRRTRKNDGRWNYGSGRTGIPVRCEQCGGKQWPQ